LDHTTETDVFPDNNYSFGLYLNKESTMPKKTPPPSPPTFNRKKISVLSLRQMKQRGDPIAILTAYDYPTARALEQAAVDAILVGDSLGMVVLGYSNTLPVTMEEMLHHSRAVARGAKSPLLIGDMPFMSYQASTQEAVRNAGRFLQEAGMDAVKLEGGQEHITTIRAIISAGIPVMGHLGLTPQSIHQLGGFKPQGLLVDAAQVMLENAQLLQAAGCFSIVLESIPQELAAYISQHLEIPTIGIGAGSGCDGQVLVSHDVLGLFDRFTPSFAKRYADLHSEMKKSFTKYIEEVKSGQFPGAEHQISMPDNEWQAFLDENEN
jgi:3-methyl-2-oxobutanoate hydroxymethyltransferase